AGPSSADSESAAEDRAAPDAVDIGGSALLRAAAKNHTSTWVASAPSEYTELLEGLRASDDRAAQRRRLAQRAFARTSRYDAEVAGALSRDDGT
ncbi:MAG: bifunctional phosphoribosylaminoimidazolecarboxamide formyltransferase/IMP cyclohydrolase, partial [Bradymonadaceae bacterium]